MSAILTYYDMKETEALIKSKLLSERIAGLERQVDLLRDALTRLSSMEAFAVSRPIEYPRDNELIARIEYAKDKLVTSFRQGSQT